MIKLTAVTPTETYNVDILDAEVSSPCAIYRYVLCRDVIVQFVVYCVIRS